MKSSAPTVMRGRRVRSRKQKRSIEERDSEETGFTNRVRKPKHTRQAQRARSPGLGKGGGG
jgi:hypothetical protein